MLLEPVWSKHFASVSAFIYIRVRAHLYVLYIRVCVCGRISACKHVAGSEEQQCIHYHQSEPRASLTLMAAIIKKAFRGGCATKGGKVGAAQGWLECRTPGCQKDRLVLCERAAENGGR